MRRALYIGGAVTVALVLGLAALIWLTLRASLPQLDGHAALAILRATAVIERDAAGVPTLSATNRLDLSAALGYVHAQDRFFQMDLQRRAAAGELAALLGPALLHVDKQLRPHRLRTVARAVVAAMDPDSRALLDAYVAGVNAGLASLASRPFEYWILRSVPQRWRAEDSVLCLEAMFIDLQDGAGQRQLQRGLLRDTLPKSLWTLLEGGAVEWDAAIDATRGVAAPLPAAADVDLRSRIDLPTAPPTEVLHELAGLGSNNWAVAGSATTTGAALVSNDMHLGYRVPNIWYRARLRLTAPAPALDVTGVSLPGTPAMTAGSNGAIAWGFTNSYGEYSAVIRLVPEISHHSDIYRTHDGTRTLNYVDEAIEVNGAPTEHLRVGLSEWGPVLGKDWTGQPYALLWTAQDPAAVNFNLIALERARNVDEALAGASQFGMPAQNLMVGDTAGHIAWSIAGRIPLRNVSDSVPESSTDLDVGFASWVNATSQPRVRDPVQGYLWSANSRVVGGVDAAIIGDGGMDRGSRAAQIRDDLQSAPRPMTPRDSLNIQLDDRALFLERWRKLAVELLTSESAAGQDAHAESLRVLKTWSGRALPDDAAFRWVVRFRAEVEARVFYTLVSPARQRAPDFKFRIPSAFEGPLWQLLQNRPLHLLATRYTDWNALLLEAVGASESLPPRCNSLRDCTWGKVNEVDVRHPLSVALPFLGRFLDMPTVQVPGAHEDMPRIQGSDYGASERFSVSPGHESEGYFHMPGAQSGHPLSAFYRNGFDAWARGRATPFLPGAPAYRLQLDP